MSDDVDFTTERDASTNELIVRDVCRRAAEIPKGEPGECHYCGEDLPRVVLVTDPKTDDNVLACGRCRDKRGIH